MFSTGRGPWLWTADGTRFFDATAGSGAVSLGHQYPPVVEAVVRQAQRLTHTGCKLGSDIRDELTGRLAGMVPFEDARILPTVTGSEAVESALKVARAATGHRAVVTLDRSFHGKTAGALALTWRRSLKEYSGPAPEAVWRIDPPDPRQGQDTTAVERARAVIAQASADGGLAAVVIEPVQTTEGVLPLPPTFVDAVIELAHRAGGLAVLDEIYTGLGRCGLLFYSEQLRQKPDLVVLGKTLGNGSPIATVVGPAAVVDALPAGLQTSTFSGNPISCAAAVAVLDSVLEEDLPRRARGLQDRLRAHGEYMTSEFPFVAGWRVTGGLAAFDCIDTEGRLAPELARAFARCALAEGLLLFTGGAEESTVKIVPPLVLTDGEIDALATGLTAAARRTRSWGADQ